MNIRNNKYITIILDNKYPAIFIVATIWMIFFDSNSLLMHLNLNKSIDKLEARKEYYKEEITNDRKALKELENNPDKLEKYARERFLMKKENEDIFIIKEKE